MGLDATNPQYDARIDEWTVMQDTYAGSTAIKNKSVEYLPPTAGMLLDFKENRPPGCVSVAGLEEYRAYLNRALFHDFVSDAVEAMIGFMHRKPPKIDLPEVMEPLRRSATVNGESLEQLLRRINVEQLVPGRVGLLADLPAKPTTATDVIPYIAVYHAPKIRNWDDDTDSDDTISNLNMVVLDESRPVRTRDFTWENETRYRVLILGNADANESPGAPGTWYRMGVFSNIKRSGQSDPDAGNGSGDASLEFNEADLIEPVFRGQRLSQIPFVFINSKDITPNCDDPPLLGLAELSLAVYRGEADYRQSLHKQGQDTLVVIGGGPRGPNNEEGWRIGSGASIEVQQGGDAKFIGVSATGLPEQRNALENDKKAAAAKASVLLDTNQGAAESGDALAIRVAARTSSLTQLALAGAAGLEKLLKIIAEWMGANPEEVSVTPNLEFAEGSLTGDDMVKIMTARTMGFPLSIASIHALAQDRGLTKLGFDEEMEIIGEENANAGNGGGGTGIEDQLLGGAGEE